jgi:hypothetical protein
MLGSKFGQVSGWNCASEKVSRYHLKLRDLAIFLGIEVFAIVWAAVMFSTLASKLLAGALAGGYFIVSGLVMLGMANHWPRKWKSLTWYVLFIHVFVISIPMVMSRFAQMALSFEDVRIFGIPGPMFHNISSGVFSVLIAATVIDGVRTWWAT